MKMQIFAVRDMKTEQFGNPMFLMTKGHALRSFTDEVNRKDEQNMLNKHPEDFVLYHLGDYDTESGEFTTMKPTQMVMATEVKA
jgi:hypothetical protein